MEERGEVSYSALSRRFKSSSKPIRSLQAKGLVSISKREVCRDLSVQSELKAYPKPELSTSQEAALDGDHKKYLLEAILYISHLRCDRGVERPKTYLRAIEEVLAQGREAIVLVQKISLTPQILFSVQGSVW